MIALAALLSVAAGAGLAGVVHLQLRGDTTSERWLLTATALVAALCGMLLWLRWGWTPRFWLLFGAAVVLIDTAAVDWQLKLIDMLLLAIATGAAVVCAPWIMEGPAARWSSLAGMAAAGGALAVAWLAARLLYRAHAEPFGLGDVVLGAYIGALFGARHVAPALLLGIVLAGLAGLVLVLLRGFQQARGMALPYGTFLCLGALGYLLIA